MSNTSTLSEAISYYQQEDNASRFGSLLKDFAMLTLSKGRWDVRSAIGRQYASLDCLNGVVLENKT